MRILYLTHRLPYAPNRGDRIRAFHMLRHMTSFATVSLFSLVHDDEEEARAASMPGLERVAVARVRPLRKVVRGAMALPTSVPLTHALLDARTALQQIESITSHTDPELVVAYCSGVARFALQPPLATRPFVLDMVDVDSMKWRQLSDETSMPLKWIYRRESRLLGAFERTASTRARHTLVVNDREAAALRTLAPAARITVVQNGIDVEAFAPRDAPTEEPIVLFCGVMNYPPNEEGVLWFCRDVWPEVRRRVPSARFRIVGSDPGPSIRRLRTSDASVEVVGRVAEVPPYLWSSAVAVAPLIVARGLQNKALEALAAGLPVVMTPAVAAGLPQPVLSGCRIAQDASAFASAIVELLSASGRERRALAARAPMAEMTWGKELSGLQPLLRSAV